MYASTWKPWAAATLLIGLAMYLPFWNSAGYLATGDHGADLYAYAQTALGQTPYRDYFWNYGPLMPYYYALWMKLLGIGIKSVLVGHMLLQILAGILVFRIVNLAGKESLACVAAAWYWAFCPQFIHTYNHVGGVAAILCVLYGLLAWLGTNQPKYLYASLPFILALFFIKLNMGVFVYACFVAVLLMRGLFQGGSWELSELKRVVTLLIVLPIMVGSVYLWLIRDLPLYYIWQCFPFVQGYDPSASSLLDALHKLGGTLREALRGENQSFEFISLYRSPWPTRLFVGLFAVSIAHVCVHVWRKGPKSLLAAPLIVALLSLAVAHEYLMSETLYRLYWALPLIFVLSFYLISLSMQRLKAGVSVALIGLMFGFVAWEFNGRWQYRHSAHDSAPRWFPSDRAHVYVSNRLAWLDTVTQTTKYLQEHLDESDLFLAAPYDPLYYFLTRKKAPIRELMMYEFTHITDEQEQQMIADLEDGQVGTVLLSNRQDGSQENLGRFGETYCVALAQYIHKNFKLMKSFGDWREGKGGWATSHATRIYQRQS